ncbi:MAG: DUF4279 domain-containing protein [Youngiibacter sp.]|nr:DUF4279 domain-containing protein [Youngiibacter sp.]
MSYSGYICLKISGDDIDFQSIEDSLGVHATEFQKAGEETVSKYGTHTYKSDSWLYEIEYDEIVSISKSIHDFMTRFKDSGESIKKIHNANDIILWRDLYSDYFQIGFSIEPTLMKWLAGLGVQLDIQIYLHGRVSLSRNLPKMRSKGR